MSSGVGTDGLVMGLAELLMDLEEGLLEWLMGFGKGLWCGVGMCLVDGKQLLAG